MKILRKTKTCKCVFNNGFEQKGMKLPKYNSRKIDLLTFNVTFHCAILFSMNLKLSDEKIFGHHHILDK